MKKIYKNIKYKWAFWISFAVAIALLVASFLLPPLGAISPSVLQGVAEIFAFALLGIVADAIQRGADIKLSKGDMSVELDNPDNEN